MIFFTKDLDHRHFLQKYPDIELYSMKKSLNKKQLNLELYIFNFIFSKMTQSLRQL